MLIVLNAGFCNTRYDEAESCIWAIRRVAMGWTCGKTMLRTRYFQIKTLPALLLHYVFQSCLALVGWKTPLQSSVTAELYDSKHSPSELATSMHWPRLVIGKRLSDVGLLVRAKKAWQKTHSLENLPIFHSRTRRQLVFAEQHRGNKSNWLMWVWIW